MLLCGHKWRSWSLLASVLITSAGKTAARGISIQVGFGQTSKFQCLLTRRGANFRHRVSTKPFEFWTSRPFMVIIHTIEKFTLPKCVSWTSLAGSWRRAASHSRQSTSNTEGRRSRNYWITSPDQWHIPIDAPIRKSLYSQEATSTATSQTSSITGATASLYSAHIVVIAAHCWLRQGDSSPCEFAQESPGALTIPHSLGRRRSCDCSKRGCSIWGGWSVLGVEFDHDHFDLSEFC